VGITVLGRPIPGRGVREPASNALTSGAQPVSGKKQGLAAFLRWIKILRPKAASTGQRPVLVVVYLQHGRCLP
jgi:hypothetical protein